MKFAQLSVDEVGFAAPKVFCKELGGIREQKLKNLNVFTIGRAQRCSAPFPCLDNTKLEAENFVIL